MNLKMLIKNMKKKYINDSENFRNNRYSEKHKNYKQNFH